MLKLLLSFLLLLAWKTVSAVDVIDLLSSITSDDYDLISTDYFDLVDLATNYSIYDQSLDDVNATPDTIIEPDAGSPTGYLNLFMYQSACSTNPIAYEISFPTGVCFSSPSTSFILTVTTSTVSTLTVYEYVGAGCVTYLSSGRIPFSASKCYSTRFLLTYTSIAPTGLGQGTLIQYVKYYLVVHYC